MTPESLAPSPDYPDKHLSCRLGDLGEVVPVADEDKSLARSMMASHHPAGLFCCRPSDRRMLILVRAFRFRRGSVPATLATADSLLREVTVRP